MRYLPGTSLGEFHDAEWAAGLIGHSVRVNGDRVEEILDVIEGSDGLPLYRVDSGLYGAAELELHPVVSSR